MMSGSCPLTAQGWWRGADALNDIVGKIESGSALDRPAQVVRRGVSAILSASGLRSWLSGSFLGHALHPLLTDLPLGCWSSAALLDFTHQAPTASRRLVGAGILAALPTVSAGLSDWMDTTDAEQRVGLVHGMGNLVGIACMAGSWLRRRSRPGGDILSFAGLAVVSLSGWLGGHLSYAMGVGVDTNAFHTGPDRWSPTRSDDAARPLSCHEVGGVRIAVTKLADGTTYAMADRCSHRGGPLSNGDVEGDCITCPWHKSQFDVRTGTVRRGPASVAQPTYEVRTVGSHVEVRRSERRALRRNPV
jgi:nitrite reductase/ring-hydroxylating ferredoxin subunit/uncharacterized membrane protein